MPPTYQAKRLQSKSAFRALGLRAGKKPAYASRRQSDGSLVPRFVYKPSASKWVKRQQLNYLAWACTQRWLLREKFEAQA